MKKLIIIGAGASGLSAASQLIKLGFNAENLIILEAQSRIGGRVHTVIEDGHQIEMGAQWVHGEVDNKVFEIASEAGELNTNIRSLESSGFDESVVFKFEGAPALSKEQVVEFITFVQSIWDASTSEEMKNWNGSLGEFAMRQFEEERRKGMLSSLDDETVSALVDWFFLMQNLIDGSDDAMSTCGSGHTHYRECEGDPLVTWKRGYSSVFDILMKDVPKSGNGQQLPLSDRILLDKPVRNIEWDRKEIGENAVQVTCEDGSIFRADYLLVTCSLGVLKAQAQKLFTPALPLQKTRAIEGLGFGTVDKIYLKFQAPWWNKDWGGISFLRPRKTLKSGQPHWSDGILGFYTVRLQPNILVVWVTGSAARHMETLPADQVMKVSSDLLRRFIQPDFPNYTEPVKIIRSTWFSNPFTRGSYSYRSTRSKEMNVWASDLAQPVCDSTGRARLFFAGEATHDYYYSTVHGAIESGLREAVRLAKYCMGVHAKL